MAGAYSGAFSSAYDTGGGGGTDTPLDAQPGSLALTGFATGFSVGFVGSPTTLIPTGSVTSFAAGLNSAPVALALTGFPAELIASGNAVLDAQSGPLVLTGLTTGFAIGLAVSPGGLTASVQTAAFALALAASPVAITLTGFPATLVVSGIVDPGIRAESWSLTDSPSAWRLADGGNRWALSENRIMPAIADPVLMHVGERRWLTGDFGNLRELKEGQDVASCAVAVSPSNGGVTFEGKTDGPYYSGAWFTANTPGEYVVTWTATLTGGGVIPRKAALVVE